MNLHRLLTDALNGRSNSVAIVCAPNAITLTPANPVAVPVGWGLKGNVTGVTLKSGDPCEATIHMNILGFRKDEVRKI